MGFAAPLGLLALTLLAPVIAMYLLKRRREEEVVSSVYLWQQVIQDIEANAPWQRLRRNLLLLLQLLFLLLAIFGLARPFFTTLGVTGQSVIVVLDSSLSMAAQDVPEGSRFDAAEAEVMRLAQNMSDTGRMTIIRGGDGADILAANSNDQVAIEVALETVQPAASDSDLTPALTLAAAVAAREAESEIVVVSDGAVQLPASLAVEQPIRYLPMGNQSNNQAISAINLTRLADGYELFVQITNYSSEPITRRLVINIEGSLFTASDLTLPAGQQTSKIFTLPLADTFQVEARLAGDADHLAADDVAWAVPGPSGERKIRLMTPSVTNRFLSVPFSILPNVQFSQGYVLSDTVEVDGERADLLILDRWLPENGLPGSSENLLIVNPPAGHDIIQSTGTITGVIPFKLGVLPSIEENLFFESDLFFVEASKTSVPTWGTVVLQDERSGAPLLWVGEQEGRQIVVFNIAIYGNPKSIPLDPPRDVVLTNLVYQPTYPVLMASLANYLLVGPAGGLAGQSVPPNQLMNLPLLDASTLEIEQPNGGSVTLNGTDNATNLSFTPTERGIYTINWPNSTQPPIQFAVNLFAPTESNIAPVPDLALNTSINGATNTNESQLVGEGQREIWRPLLLLGLLVLMIEWMVYQKDGLARLRTQLGWG